MYRHRTYRSAGAVDQGVLARFDPDLVDEVVGIVGTLAAGRRLFVVDAIGNGHCISFPNGEVFGLCTAAQIIKAEYPITGFQGVYLFTDGLYLTSEFRTRCLLSGC